mmetsp:Transcript_28704/g.65682  ORF Transcript_28704/g.65682 Transcript_28704/m.65682 type:complete len:207 (+) Transcript_28704:203-823(+)
MRPFPEGRSEEDLVGDALDEALEVPLEALSVHHRPRFLLGEQHSVLRKTARRAHHRLPHHRPKPVPQHESGKLREAFARNPAVEEPFVRRLDHPRVPRHKFLGQHRLVRQHYLVELVDVASEERDLRAIVQKHSVQRAPVELGHAGDDPHVVEGLGELPALIRPHDDLVVHLGALSVRVSVAVLDVLDVSRQLLVEGQKFLKLELA